MATLSVVFNTLRAIFTRVIFSFHATLTVWYLTKVKNASWPWLLLLTQVGNLIEAIVTLKVKKASEWKWLSPSVLFFLMSAVPPVWLLELHYLENRIQSAEPLHLADDPNDTVTTTTESTVDNATVEHIKILQSLGLDDGLWLKILEQGLLLLLVIGRWTLPKGELTHDQLSQLLLVYVGMAADIAEFYDSFNEPGVDTNRFVSCVILAVWSVSLLQFALVLTEGAGRADEMHLLTTRDKPDHNYKGCCSPELYGIVVSIFLQDLPFLIVRLVIIVRFNVISYTNVFFTAKNSMVIVFLLYRLLSIRSESVIEDVVSGEQLASNKNASARREEPVLQHRNRRPELPLTTFLLTQDGGRVNKRSKLRSRSEPRRTSRL